jgi:hypothetical protein
MGAMPRDYRKSVGLKCGNLFVLRLEPQPLVLARVNELDL